MTEIEATAHVTGGGTGFVVVRINGHEHILTAPQARTLACRADGAASDAEGDQAEILTETAD